MDAGRLDFVVFGSTGYTGKFVVKEVALKVQSDTSITWAVAGRSRNKILQCLREAETETGYDLHNSVKVITADVDDYDSLVAMASQAKVVLNCVGPYRFFGEPVVRACVEAGASHVDISGEPEFLEKMEVLYDGKAKETGSYVIGSCGFDSIPSDVGLVFCKKQFNGSLSAVDITLRMHYGEKGPGVNTGTWNTLVNSVANWGELKKLRAKSTKPKCPKPAFSNPQRKISNPDGEGYCVPFQGADNSVIYRSQRDEYVSSGALPVAVNVYLYLGRLPMFLTMVTFGFFLFLLSLTKIGRWLLVKFPRFFSGGIIYPEGPPMDIVKEQSFSFLIKCQGYSAGKPLQGRPDRTMVCRITGPDPGYVATSSFLVEAAYTILREKDKLPQGGGVLTPGFAFKNSTIIERLMKRNIKFEALEQ